MFTAMYFNNWGYFVKLKKTLNLTKEEEMEVSPLKIRIKTIV